MAAPRSKLLVAAEATGDFAVVKKALRGLIVEAVPVMSGEALREQLEDAGDIKAMIAVVSPTVLAWLENCRAQQRAAGLPWIGVCCAEVADFAEQEELCYRLGALDVLASLDAARLRNKLRNWLDLLETPAAPDRESESDAAKVLQSVGGGIVVIDGAGIITHANVAAGKLLGCDYRDLEGTEFSRWLTDRRTRRHRIWMGNRIARRVRDAGSFHSDSMRLRRADGTVFPAEIHATPHVDQPGVVVLSLTDVSERQRRELRLIHAAQHDELTGLSNRHHFTSQVDAALVRTERRKAQAALIVMDLDGFDAVNRRYGRDIGDQLLIMAAERLRRRFRASDSIARVAADEFAVLVEETRSPDDVAQIARDTLDLLCEPYGVQGLRIEITASIGVAQTSDDVRETASLIQGAEAALQRARAGGARSLAIFDASWEAARTRSAVLRTALARAVDHNELELFFQPRVDLNNGAINGWEALVRWHHPEMGFLTPDVFLGLANDTGAIEEVGQWVVDAAARQVRDWKDAGLWNADMVLGVNVTDAQLTRFNIAQALEVAARTYEIDPGSIDVEVAEESVLRHGGIHRAAARLGERGFGVVLDNFGANLTSINLLRNVPFRAVKLDRTLVRDLAGRTRGSYAIGAVLGLSSSLQLNVVAEGVETREQADWLRNAGCGMAAGYLYSRPVPAMAATELLAGRYLGPQHVV